MEDKPTQRKLISNSPHHYCSTFRSSFFISKGFVMQNNLHIILTLYNSNRSYHMYQEEEKKDNNFKLYKRDKSSL
jgi:hypothetical protein